MKIASGADISMEKGKILSFVLHVRIVYSTVYYLEIEFYTARDFCYLSDKVDTDVSIVEPHRMFLYNLQFNRTTFIL